MVIAILVIGYCGMIEKRELSSKCESNGGVLISTHKKYYCLDKKAIINDERNNPTTK